MTNQAINAYGEKSAKAIAEAEAAQSRANAIYDLPMPIEAEMKILGNPHREFIDPQFIFQRTCSVIFINPFSLDKSASADLCGDWLADPPVNQLLTNKDWFVQGITHTIRDGKYTTTLKLFLPAPGVDMRLNTNMGGDPNAPKVGDPNAPKVGDKPSGSEPSIGEIFQRKVGNKK